MKELFQREVRKLENKFGMILIDENEVEHELIFTLDVWNKIIEAVQKHIETLT